MTTDLEKRIDPRVKRTRQSLEQAFTDALREKGFQAITVQDIASRAGVNRATFYAHFPDKYALLDHSIRQGFVQEIEKRMLNACTYTPGNLRNLILAVCEFTRNASSNCQAPHGQFESLVETQVKAVLHELLLKWLAKLKMDGSAESAATAASWAIYGLAAQWNHAQKQKPAEAFADEVLPLIRANLRLTTPP